MTAQKSTEPGYIYRVKNGDVWGVSSVNEAGAVLFCVEPCGRTMVEHWQFVHDNRLTPEHLRGEMFNHPRHRVIEVDNGWFNRPDVSREICNHKFGACKREGDGLFCESCGAEPVFEKQEDCPTCDGDGDLGEDGFCGCPLGLKEEAEYHAQFDYMIPMVARAMAAKRAGDDDEYERIRLEAIR